LRRDFEKAIRINLEGSNELSFSTRQGIDVVKLEFAKQTIFMTLSPLSFVTVILSCKKSRPDQMDNQRKTYTGNVTVV
jgi:hypothetical protein